MLQEKLLEISAFDNNGGINQFEGSTREIFSQVALKFARNQADLLLPTLAHVLANKYKHRGRVVSTWFCAFSRVEQLYLL